MEQNVQHDAEKFLGFRAACLKKLQAIEPSAEFKIFQGSTVAELKVEGRIVISVASLKSSVAEKLSTLFDDLELRVILGEKEAELWLTLTSATFAMFEDV